VLQLVYEVDAGQSGAYAMQVVWVYSKLMCVLCGWWFTGGCVGVVSIVFWSWVGLEAGEFCSEISIELVDKFAS